MSGNFGPLGGKFFRSDCSDFGHIKPKSGNFEDVENFATGWHVFSFPKNFQNYNIHFFVKFFGESKAFQHFSMEKLLLFGFETAQSNCTTAGIFLCEIQQKTFHFPQARSEINQSAKIFQKNQIYSKNDETTQSIVLQWIEWFLACCPRGSSFTKTDKNYQVEPNPKRLRDKAFADWLQAIAWEFRPPNRKILKIQIIGKKSKEWSSFLFEQKNCISSDF